MPRSRRSLPWLAACVAGVLFVLSSGGAALAFPTLTLRPGGTPFEGPTDADPTALAWNPAALGAIRGFHAMFRGGVEFPRGGYDRAGIDPTTGLPGAGLSFPSQRLGGQGFRYFGAFSWDFGLDNFAFGAAVYNPADSSRSFADSASFSSARQPAGYHLVSESFQHIHVGFGAALRVLQQVRALQQLFIGVSVTPIDSSADLTFYRDSALDGGSGAVSQPSALCGGAPCGYENPLAAQRLQVHGDGGRFWTVLPKPTGLQVGIGALAHVGERLWLGLSWTHVVPLPAGSSNYDRAYVAADALGARVTPAPGGGTPCGAAGDGSALPCLGGASIEYALPDVWQLGARILARDAIELSLWMRLTVWGGYHPTDPAVRNLVVRLSDAPVLQAGLPAQIVLARGLRPQVAVELFGLRWRALGDAKGSSLQLALSTIYESGAVAPEYVNPEAIDGHHFDVSAGVDWRRLLGRRFALRLTAAGGFTAWLPITQNPGGFDPTARVDCVSNGYSLDHCGADLAGRALPGAAGRYSLITPRVTAGVGIDY